jgi:hypothetical protein
MLGSRGADFYAFLKDLADIDAFKETTLTLAQEDMEQKANEELVLRFFAAKNGRQLFRGSVRDWLDDFMEYVLLDKIRFDQSAERAIFSDLFSEISKKLGETAFVKFRGQSPIGGLAPAYFEAISIGCIEQINQLRRKNGERIRAAITKMVQSEEFRGVTGPGSNSKTKLDGRIELAAKAIKDA